ncbi:MAG: hypothetical protein ACRDIE_00060 [Chloroflexota bacterium]
MHRGRFGGNARKAKAKLTDAVFHKMIGTAAQADAPIGVLPMEESVGAETEADEGEASKSVVVRFVGPSPRSATVRAFDCANYRFGYRACTNCRNEQAFYLHQDDLEHGVTFRCRVCRLELTVTSQA